MPGWLIWPYVITGFIHSVPNLVFFLPSLKGTGNKIFHKFCIFHMYWNTWFIVTQRLMVMLNILCLTNPPFFCTGETVACYVIISHVTQPLVCHLVFSTNMRGSLLVVHSHTKTHLMFCISSYHSTWTCFIQCINVSGLLGTTSVTCHSLMNQ